MFDQYQNAVQTGDTGALSSLITSGADCNVRSETGASPLMIAAHAGNLAMVQALLAAGADVHACDDRGWTALSFSIYNAEFKCGFVGVAEALIDAGADIEAPIGYGVRPLMLAAGYGETEIVDLLLRAGADVLAKNEGGYTALMMVKQKHYVDVVNLLHEAEQLSGGGGCETKHAPGVNVVTFMKRDV